MSEMIERVARALCVDDLPHKDDRDGHADMLMEAFGEMYRRKAELVIAAMHEPAKIMLDNPPQWTWKPEQKWRHFIEWALK